MKKTFFIAAGIAMLTLASCKNKDAEESTANDTIVADTSAVAVDATATTVDTATLAEPVKRVPEDVKEIMAVAGTVTAVTNGKDGYTATVLNNKDSIVYDVVISRISLKEAYKPVKAGDKILAIGEQYKVGERNTVKASSLKVKAS